MMLIVTGSRQAKARAPIIKNGPFITRHLLYAGKIALAVVCALFAAIAVIGAANGDDILGFWNNEERDGIIEIFKCGEKYCGRVVWAKEPAYPSNDGLGRAGQPRMDDDNPDPELRTRPIIGLQVVNDFIFDGETGWKGGTVYDPKSGKTYSGKMALASPNELHLRGYVLFTLFGRTTTWTRVDP